MHETAINIESKGAKQDKESTTAIQKAIDESVKSGNRLEVVSPGTNYYISDTIEVPYVSGFNARGFGGRPTNELSSTHPLRGACSQWTWTGPQDGRPMIRFTGCDVNFSNILLSGFANRDQYIRRTGEVVGMQITRGQPTGGIGTGKCGFPQIGCQWLDVGIQLAPRGAIGMGNIDNLTFGDSYFWGCKTCVEVNNEQSMGHQFRFVHNYSNVEPTTFAKINAGGDLHILQGEFISEVTVFDLDNVGHNNGLFTASNLKFDNDANKGVVLLKMRRPAKTTVRFRNVGIGGSVTGWEPTIYGEGNCHITVEGCTKLPLRTAVLTPHRTKVDGQYIWAAPHLSLRDSVAWDVANHAGDFIHESSKHPYTLEPSGLTNYWGGRVN